MGRNQPPSHQSKWACRVIYEAPQENMTYILRPQLETVRQERQNDEKAEERQKKYKDNKLGDKLLRAQQKNKSNPNMIPSPV